MVLLEAGVRGVFEAEPKAELGGGRRCLVVEHSIHVDLFRGMRSGARTLEHGIHVDLGIGRFWGELVLILDITMHEAAVTNRIVVNLGLILSATVVTTSSILGAATSTVSTASSTRLIAAATTARVATTAVLPSTATIAVIVAVASLRGEGSVHCRKNLSPSRKRGLNKDTRSFMSINRRKMPL
jgi:hypothetical protein